MDQDHHNKRRGDAACVWTDVPTALSSIIFWALVLAADMASGETEWNNLRKRNIEVWCEYKRGFGSRGRLESVYIGGVFWIRAGAMRVQVGDL